MLRVTVVLIAAAMSSAVLFAAPASALRDDVRAAVNALEKLAGDEAKVNEYCGIQDEIDAAGEDEQKLDAAYEKLDTFFDGLGEEYEPIFAIEEELPAESEETRALDAAYENLDDQCGE